VELAKQHGLSPLEFFMILLHKDSAALRLLDIQEKAVTLAIRIRAAELAAPYMHRRQPQSIDGGEGQPIRIARERLEALPDDELSTLHRILSSYEESSEAVTTVEPLKVSNG